MLELLCGAESTQFVKAIIECSSEQFEHGTWSPRGSWFINGVQAQMEPVTRAWNGCPDTIELIARIPNPLPNGVALLNVSFQEGVAPLSNGTFAAIDGYRLECVDAQNRAYNWTLTATQGVVVKNGRYQKITRFRGNVGSLLGVIVFVTQNAGTELVDLDMFIHNGLADNVVGNINFKSIKLHSLSNQEIYPKACSMRPCGRKVAAGYDIARTGNYFWPKQAGFTRRFVVSPAGFTGSRKEIKYRQEFKGQAFQLNWTNSFGVTKTGIGHVTNDLRHYGNDGLTYLGRNALKRQGLEEYASLRSALENGTAAPGVGVYDGNFGPFHPYYLAQQGAVSGFWIYHYVGWRLCWEDMAANHLFAAMNVERQPWFTYKSDGTPKTAHDFAAEGGGVVQFDFAPYDLSVNGIPAFIAAGDFNAGDADRGISQFAPHDAEHQCRYTKPLQALAYANDYLGKELLWQAAEIDYLYLNLYPQIPGWSGGQNLLTMLARANAAPHQGGLMGRGRCWAIDCVMSYYHIATPEWRNVVKTWTQRMTECLTKSQMPTGWNNRHAGDGTSQVVATANLPHQYDVAQTFEVEFEDWIKRALAVSLEPGSRLRNGLNRSMIRSASSFWNTGVNLNGNYRWFIAVGHNHGLAFTPGQLTYSLTAAQDEIFQGWYVLNHAYLAAVELENGKAGDWLEKSLQYRVAAETMQQKKAQLSQLASESWNNHLHQAIGLIYSYESSMEN